MDVMRKWSMRNVFLLCVIAVVLLSGCTKCQKPYINFGNECCLDENSNNLCDDAEKDTDDTGTDVGADDTDILDDSSDDAPTDDTSTDDTASDDGAADDSGDDAAAGTEDWIKIGANIDRLYASDYIFRESERSSRLTAFEQTYKVYAPTTQKFFIFEIQDASDYLDSYDEFYTFVERMHEIRMKEDKATNDAEVMELREESVNYKNAYYNTSYDMKEVNILEDKAVYESGLTLFNTQWGYFINARFVYSAYIWCAPNIVVRIEANKPMLSQQTTLDEETAWSRMRPKLLDMEESLPKDIKWINQACEK